MNYTKVLYREHAVSPRRGVFVPKGARPCPYAAWSSVAGFRSHMKMRFHMGVLWVLTATWSASMQSPQRLSNTKLGIQSNPNRYRRPPTEAYSREARSWQVCRKGCVIGDLSTLGTRRYSHLSTFRRRCYDHRAFVGKSAAATAFVCATSNAIPYYYRL